MARTGRPPKPPELRVLEGHRGHRPINLGPAFDKGFGPVPKTLQPVARKLWKRLAKQLDAVGLSGEVYRSMLEMACYWYAEWFELKEEIKQSGRTYETEKGFIGARPEVKMMQIAFQNMKAAFVEFGMTPSSKGRIIVPKPRDRQLEDLASTRADAIRLKA